MTLSTANQKHEVMERYSRVSIRETKESKSVKIGSDLKPEIISSLINKWQSLLDTTAKIVNVPSCLIMRLNEETIEVFLRSRTEGNPYEAGEKAGLIYGLYCETVIGTQQPLLVTDATKSQIWNKNNPDIDLNMISYLGFPINWPDGEVFGTVCLLDKKENQYNEDFINLLRKIKLHVETDLELLLANSDLKEKNMQLERLNNTKSKFLSLISHDIRGKIGILDQLLKLAIDEFENYDKASLKTLFQSLSQEADSSFQTLESLLQWAKNDLIQLEPDKTQVDIIEVIEKLLHHFQEAVRMKDLSVKKEYQSNKCLILADENMMTTSLRNILSNAIKYTQNGGLITVRVSLADQHCNIEIEDTGVGMDESTLSRLFSYYKLHGKQGTKGESSAGIGLMLTKEFLDKNNATVEIESEVGKGTRFRITI